MLLARRERQHKAALAIGIHRLSTHPARHLAHQLVARRQQTDIGAAKVQGIAEGLAFRRHNVRPHLARRL